MSGMSESSRWRAKMIGRCPSLTNLRLVSAPMTPMPPVIRTFMFLCLRFPYHGLMSTAPPLRCEQRRDRLGLLPLPVLNGERGGGRGGGDAGRGGGGGGGGAAGERVSPPPPPSPRPKSGERERPRLRYCYASISRQHAVTLPRAGCAGNRVTDAQRLRIDQHECHARPLAAAVRPGVVGAALDHDVTR